MNITKFIIGKLIPTLADTARRNIVNQINAHLFSREPFGAPLAESTKRQKKNKGSSKALYDYGVFSRGMKWKKNSKGAEVFSTGREEEQEYFIKGTKTIPTRDPFVAKLPFRGGKSIDKHISDVANVKIAHYVDSEISKLKGVT